MAFLSEWSLLDDGWINLVQKKNSGQIRKKLLLVYWCVLRLMIYYQFEDFADESINAQDCGAMRLQNEQRWIGGGSLQDIFVSPSEHVRVREQVQSKKAVCST
jgi:hypothetical protein